MPEAKVTLEFLGAEVKRLQGEVRVVERALVRMGGEVGGGFAQVRMDMDRIEARVEEVNAKLDMMRAEMDAGFNALLRAITGKPAEAGT